MNNKNSKTSAPHKFRLDLTEKLNFKHPKKNMALANLSIFYTWENIKSEYNNSKFKISALTWNDNFDLPDGSYSISDIRITLNLSSKTQNFDWKSTSSQFIKIKNRIVFKIKMDYKLELWNKTHGTMRGSTKKDFDKDKDGESVSKLEFVKVVSVHCNLVKNGYQHTSKVLFLFVPNKQFGQFKYFTRFFKNDEHS